MLITVSALFNNTQMFNNAGEILDFDHIPVRYYSGHRQFLCPCGRNYRYKRGLIAHQKFECGKQPSFQCPVCFKKYTQPSALTYHMKCVHSKPCDGGTMPIKTWISLYLINNCKYKKLYSKYSCLFHWHHFIHVHESFIFS